MAESYDDEHNGNEGAPPEPLEGLFTDVAAATTVPPSWVIRDLLPPGLTFIGGPPKSSKSTIVMAMAALVARYKCQALPPFLSQVDRGGPVLAFLAEATAGETRHQLERGLGVKLAEDGGILVADDPWSWRLDDDDGVERLMHWLEAKDPRLVVIDPLRDFHDQEEKDSGAMIRMLRPLRQWAIENEGAVIVVHHTTKVLDDSPTYDARHLRGSGAIFGKADGVLMLTPEGHDNERTAIKAVFKRAPGWERTFSLAMYGRVGQPASEVLTDLDRAVAKCWENGADTIDEVSGSLHTSKSKAIACTEKLRRNGLLAV